MSTLSLSPEAAAYLAALRTSLADLEPDERNDLLADVEVSLAEAAADGESLTERFGPPAAFAAELRLAAGLGDAPARARGGGLAVWLRNVWQSPRALQLRRTAAELAPVWWLIRAFIAVAALALVGAGRWSTTAREVPVLGSPTGSVVVGLALASASIALGLRARRGRMRRTNLAATVCLVALALPVAVHMTHARNQPQVVQYVTDQQSTPQGVLLNGQPVENIYAYDRNGNLLHDILLYDQSGRAIAIKGSDPNRRIVRTARGTALSNVFPIRYFQPGTSKVAHPNAAPRKRAPRIVTPPLKEHRRPRGR